MHIAAGSPVRSHSCCGSSYATVRSLGTKPFTRLLHQAAALLDPGAAQGGSMDAKTYCARWPTRYATRAVHRGTDEMRLQG